jgi:opacity protein-like surface antigen
MFFSAARSRSESVRKTKILFGATVAVLLSASSALAQGNCFTTQTGTFVNNIGNLAVPAGGAGAAIASAITSADSVFLTQQGSAFVSAPSNPMPDQPGGGVWARAVGGEARVSSTSTSNSVSTGTGLANNSTTTCANSIHENFAGAQVGADIARLNWNGWNVHLGTTAGYLGSKESDNNGFNNMVQVPFLGTYLVATKGRFFADLMVRENYYNISLNNPGISLFNQPVGAHGYSISTSAGYNFDLGNGWFVEPSGGFIYSRTSVDNFINPGTSVLAIPGLISTNDIESELGRLSVRVGKTIETPNIIWQPFASASVFHEFAGNVVTNYSALPNSAFFAGPPVTGVTFQQTTSTSRIGTYGQYSLGVAGQIVNTGWLGFARVDYRDGSNLSGWTGNAGIRYQFTPDMIASVMPVKVKAPPHPVIAPTNWTGFYVGGFGGVAAGRDTITYVGTPFPTAGSKPWVMGALGGGEVGYNYQFANKWVVGVEGDAGVTNTHGGQTAGQVAALAALGGAPFSGASIGPSPIFFTNQDQTNWMATLAGKLGYAWGRTLFYGKAGVAFEDSTIATACIFGPGGQLPLPGVGFRSCINQAGVGTSGFIGPRTTRVGWTLGYGTAFDLGHNWSAKAEYDFMSFGNHTALQNDGSTVLTDKSWISQVKVGVDYKFTAGPAVIAKY